MSPRFEKGAPNQDGGVRIASGKLWTIIQLSLTLRYARTEHISPHPQTHREMARPRCRPRVCRLSARNSSPRPPPNTVVGIGQDFVGAIPLALCSLVGRNGLPT